MGGVRVSNQPPFFDNRIATLQLVKLTVSSVISPVERRLLKLLTPYPKQLPTEVHYAGRA